MKMLMKTLLLVLFALILIQAAVAAEGGPDPAAQVARNKAVARRVFEEIFNQGKFRVADEIYARDFVNHGLHRDSSLQEDQAAVHAEKKAFPDLTMTVDMMVAEGDLVTAVWTFRGTHTGSGYGGLPPTGGRIEARGITVWRIVDGTIREEWTSFDQLRPYLQIASQVKWKLLGLLCAAMLLGWVIYRAIRTLRRRLRGGGTTAMPVSTS
jgi:predicted ester cyclase